MSKLEWLIKRRDYEDFNNRLLESVQEYGKLEHDAGNMVVKIVINPEGTNTVAFVAGIHGDEIGGPFGVLKFLENKIYVPEHLRVIIIPVANPSAFELRARENKDDIDINRHFFDETMPEECQCLWDMLKDEKLELLHTLHEDVDLKSFYCYYSHHKTLAEQIRALASRYFTIYNETEESLYDDKVVEGLIPLPHIFRGTIEDKVLAENNVPYITTESPGKMSVSRRAKFNCDVMKLVINEL